MTAVIPRPAKRVFQHYWPKATVEASRFNDRRRPLLHVAPGIAAIFPPRRTVKSGFATTPRFRIQNRWSKIPIPDSHIWTRRALAGAAMNHSYQFVAIALSLFALPSAWAQDVPSKQIAARTELHQIQSLTLSDQAFLKGRRHRQANHDCGSTSYCPRHWPTTRRRAPTRV